MGEVQGEEGKIVGKCCSKGPASIVRGFFVLGDDLLAARKSVAATHKDLVISGRR
jgi:hypothetical protein